MTTLPTFGAAGVIAVVARIASDDTPQPLLTPAAPTAPVMSVPVPAAVSARVTSLGSVLPDWSAGEWIGYSALALIAIGLTVVAVSTLWWMLHAWRDVSSLAATRFPAEPREAAHRFTLLVPARHEEQVLGETLDRLARQTHPDFEIIAIVGHDDPGTELVAREAAARHPHLITVLVDDSVPKNKPKALNLALTVATGDVVGVFDAEDEVHPNLLALVDTRFEETAADVVQGGVQLMNFQSSWWALRNVLEYYFWFRSRLHFHARSRFIPLGGNTVFVKRTWLDWSRGWDADCLAEDCELGVRLSSAGAHVVVAYSPDVVTREETPGTFTSLYKQRTRWNQGFLQVLGKGEWRNLPTRRQRGYARYLLSMPFLQAGTGLLVPVSVVLALVVKVPTPLALLTFLPLVPTVITVAAEIAGLAEFGRLYGPKPRLVDYARLVLGTFPFQVFLAGAAVRAVFRQLKGENSWEKTEHTGAHRDAPEEAIAPARDELVGATVEMETN